MNTDSYMMQTPLITSDLIEYAEIVYPKVEVISRENNDQIVVTNYGEIGARARAVASALIDLGIDVGDKVGAFAWSTRRYLELFYAVPGMGAALHTINLRLHPDDLVYIINDAADKALCVDSLSWKTIAAISEQLTTVEHYIWLDDIDAIPEHHPFKHLYAYDDLARQGDAQFRWPVLDELSGCTICYTSGTTGRPKGVVYTHRGNVLMTLSSTSKGFYGYPERDGSGQSFLSLTGMFHANAWMMPFAAPLLGARLALVGRDYAPDKLMELVDVGQVSLAAGVPTILQSMVDYAIEHKRDFGTVTKVVLSGSKPARGLVETLETQFNLEVGQAWGMTEAQMGSMPILKSEYSDLSRDEKTTKKYRGGLMNFGIKQRLIDDDGNDVPFDGKTPGHFIVKGPWVISRYLNHSDADTSGYMTDDGWFKTGDIACIHPDGYLELVDRSKDLIKSGGEWIGSAIIEAVATSHPAIQESAVIGIPHPKWQERPLLIAVKKSGCDIDDEGIKNYLKGQIASWWIPDDVVFVDEIPRTATGKINKVVLKKQYVPLYEQHSQ
ncbi:MAG: AMP-binding protein [Porticoccaceae bacterium]|nr:AMP-binding protein [Porticoccaceae bacterium]